MGAAVSGNIELMQALVEAGANINAQDEQVWSCVSCCICTNECVWYQVTRRTALWHAQCTHQAWCPASFGVAFYISYAQ
jgi:hypothetical protein